MPTVSQAITIDAPKLAVYKALTTTDGLLGWYSDQVEGNPDKGGEFTLSFTKHEGPFRWKVTAAEPGALVQWTCVAGPGQSTGTVVTFRLSETGKGRTAVELDHEGFEDTDQKLKVCNTLWGGLVLHLRKYVESHDLAPALR